MEDYKRALAYITTIDEIKPLDGYDRVEYARTKGWWVVVSKADEMKVGDKCVYFEIDSLLPDTDERFAFMEKKHYKVKTQKMCRVFSQGLIMSLKYFPELQDLPEGTDVTEKLGVKYYVPEDNERKRNTPNPNAKYDNMARRHKDLFKKPIIRKMMKTNWGRKLLFALYGDKNDAPKSFPSFIHKTDEIRIENCPHVLADTDKWWILTEKLDGTSSTYVLERKSKNGLFKPKYEFYVCSRNMRLRNEDKDSYDGGSIYWDMAFKYDIEKHLTEYLGEHKDLSWVCLQGESVGNVQGNPLKLKEDDLYVFNFIDSENGRLNSQKGAAIVNGWGMNWVPILGMEKVVNDMEEMKLRADGQSFVNPKVKREGIVYRSEDGKQSFKNVSRKYLLSKG